MKFVTAFAFAAVIATPAFAASSWEGTWKADIASAKFPERPYVLSVKDGVFTCSSCKPVFSVKTDGAFHKVVGFPYADEAAIKIVDAKTIEETDKLKGKLVGTSRLELSADGAVLTTKWTDTSAPDGKTISGQSTQTRLKPAAAGAHGISGEWKSDKVADISADALTVSFKQTGDVVNMSTPNGYHYDAKLGGPAVPVVGDPAGAKVTVVKLADGSLEESTWLEGKVLSVMTLTPAADGATLAVKQVSKKYDTTTTYTMIKQ